MSHSIPSSFQTSIKTQTLLHLSSIGAFLFPFLGIAVSLFFLFSSQDPFIKTTSRRVLNFNLTLTFLLALSYLCFSSIVAIPFTFVLLGYCFFAAFFFPLQAVNFISRGLSYTYPHTISFVRDQHEDSCS